MWETKEKPVESLGWEDPLEEGATACFSILAWRILCTEEPGRLLSAGLPNQTLLSDLAHSTLSLKPQLKSILASKPVFQIVQ